MHKPLLLCALITLTMYAQQDASYQKQVREQFKQEMVQIFQQLQAKAIPKIPANEQLPLVIILYDDTAEDVFISKSLQSALKQEYENYRIIYVIDKKKKSAITTLKQMRNEVERRVTITTYDRNEGMLSTLHTAISGCHDEEIIILLKASDWLAETWSLVIICDAYKGGSNWFTYGSCTSDPKDVTIGMRTAEVPQEIQEKRLFRDVFPYMPPITFYTWLFKQIKKEDLIDPKTGSYYKKAIESYLIWPLIEMAADHFSYLKLITYVVNNNDPLKALEQDYYLRLSCNAQMDKVLPVYQPLQKPIFDSSI